MKRLATTLVLTTLAFGVPAASAGAATDYQGPTEAGGTISFTKKGSKLKKFAFQAVPVDCKRTDPATTSGKLRFNERIRDGKFKVRAVAFATDGSVNARLVVNGKIKGSNASGTFEVYGRKLKIDQGGREKCQSGKLDWNAGAIMRAGSSADAPSYSRR